MRNAFSRSLDNILMDVYSLVECNLLESVVDRMS